MSVQELETVIAQLPPADLAELAHWLQEFQVGQETQAQDQEADAWDRQIAADVQAGRLDALVARAKEQVQDGQYRQHSAMTEAYKGQGNFEWNPG